MTEDHYSSRNNAARFIVDKWDDSGKFNHGSFEESEDFFAPTKVMHIQPHGFSSVPKKGAHLVGLNLGSRYDSMVSFGGEHPDHKPKDLGEGNVALYNADGSILKMVGKNSSWKQEGDHVHEAKSSTIKCGDVSVKVDKNGVEMKVGDVTLKLDKNGVSVKGGSIKHDDHKIDSSHRHTNSGGVGLGGPPE